MQKTQEQLDYFKTHLVDLKDEVRSERDIADIAQAFRENYGENYFDVFLDSAKLKALIDDPNTYTFVSRANDGTFVGTGSLMIKGPMAELGRVIVPKKFRGQDVFQEKRFKGIRVYDVLIEKRMNLAGEKNVRLLYSAAVTNHGGSQAALVRRNFTAVAIQDSKYIPITPDELGVGRESTVLMVYRGSDFSQYEKRPIVFVPKELEKSITATLNALKQNMSPPIFKKPRDLEREIDSSSTGHLGMKFQKHRLDNENQHLRYVLVPRSDLGLKGIEIELYPFAEKVHQDMEQQGLQYTEVEVAVNSASGRSSIHALVEHGFKYGGFLPSWIHSGRAHDAVLMTLSKPGQKNLDKLVMTPETQRVKDDYLSIN